MHLLLERLSNEFGHRRSSFSSHLSKTIEQFLGSGYGRALHNVIMTDAALSRLSLSGPLETLASSTRPARAPV